MAKRGFKTLLVTLEDPEDIAAAVVAGHVSRQSIFALDTGMSSDFTRREVDEAWEGMASIPMWTVYARTIQEIVSVCSAHKATHGLDAIGIDHIQYISPYQLPKMDRNGTVALYSGAICGMLKDLDAAGLVASQFSRRAESEGRRPKLSDLRDSGTLEQDCRQALLLSRDGDNHILEVAKNNFGPSGQDITLRRIGQEHRFEAVESTQGSDMV
jgi:replicative DNA helicase